MTPNHLNCPAYGVRTAVPFPDSLHSSPKHARHPLTCLAASVSAPAVSSSRTTSTCPNWDAMNSGVAPVCGLGRGGGDGCGVEVEGWRKGHRGSSNGLTSQALQLPPGIPRNNVSVHDRNTSVPGCSPSARHAAAAIHERALALRATPHTNKHSCGYRSISVFRSPLRTLPSPPSRPLTCLGASLSAPAATSSRTTSRCAFWQHTYSGVEPSWGQGHRAGG